MFKCSQLVCRVEDIKQVVKDYEALGFAVQWGSNPKNSQNAFLWFETGPHIEFFRIPSPLRCMKYPFSWFLGKAAGKRWEYWFDCPHGWCDIALETYRENYEVPPAADFNYQELIKVKSTFDNLGLNASKVIKGGRTKPDGEKVKYSFFAPEAVGLPFVLSHYDPPQRPKKVHHANGVTGVAWIKVGVTEDLIDRYRQLTLNDTWIRLEVAPQNGILAVGLCGDIKTEFNKKLLHGAVFSTAADM